MSSISLDALIPPTLNAFLLTGPFSLLFLSFCRPWRLAEKDCLDLSITIYVIFLYRKPPLRKKEEKKKKRKLGLTEQDQLQQPKLQQDTEKRVVLYLGGEVYKLLFGLRFSGWIYFLFFFFSFLKKKNCYNYWWLDVSRQLSGMKLRKKSEQDFQSDKTLGVANGA